MEEPKDNHVIGVVGMERELTPMLSDDATKARRLVIVIRGREIEGRR